MDLSVSDKGQRRATIQGHQKNGRDLKPLQLKHYLFPQIETFEQETLSRAIFMQDGAPPHFSCFVTDVLNERFPDAWIGRSGPIPWQPRSPDLSPLDFFLWGYIKNIVYAEKIKHIQHLQERITSATETVTRDMIQKT